jgi:predicted heme/steroid binding protein
MIPSVKIGPVNYTVREMNDLHTVNDDGKKLELHGHILWSEAEIRVANDQVDDVKVATIWHEAVHGLLHNAGQDDHPESMVIALGYGLVQLIRDNPQLIELTVNGIQPTPPTA